MRIVSKYIFKEITKAYLISLFILVSIFSIFNFLEELGDHYPLESKIYFVVLSLPSTTYLLFSLAMIIGTLIAIGNLNSNKELSIILTGGISRIRLIKTILNLVLVISLISITLSEIFSPTFYEKAIQLKAIASGKNYSNSSNNIWLIKKNTFVNIDKINNQDNIENISLFDFDKNNNLVSYLVGDNAVVKDKRMILSNKFKTKINLKNGIYSYNALSLEDKVSLDLNKNQIRNLERDVKAMNLYDLFSTIFFLKQDNLENEIFVREIIFRLLQPINIISLIIIAIPLVMRIKRNVSIGNMIFAGISLSLVFHLLTRFFDALTTAYEFNVYISSFIPTLIVATFAILISKKYLSSS